MTPDEQIQHDDAGERSQEPGARRSGLRAFMESVGLVAPKQGNDPYAHRRGEPRGFSVIWLVFLLLAAAVVYSSVGSPVLASAEGYRFSSKILLTTVALGMVTIWPGLRLSQRAPVAGGVAAMARDLVIVLVPLQAIIWPQALITGWSIEVLALIAVVLTAWAFLIAAVVASALGPGHRGVRSKQSLAESDRPVSPVVRTLAMASVLVLVCIGPLGVLVGSDAAPDSDSLSVSDLFAMVSPLSAPWEVLSDRVWTGQRASVTPSHWRIGLLSLFVGLAAWGGVFVLQRPRTVAADGGSA